MKVFLIQNPFEKFGRPTFLEGAIISTTFGIYLCFKHGWRIKKPFPNNQPSHDISPLTRERNLNPHNGVANFQPLLVQASTENMTDPKSSKNEAKPTLLYLVTEDWYFCSHRLTLARRARNKGYNIIVATRVNNHKEQIKKEGFKLISIPLIRRSKNVLHELSSLLNIVQIYKKVRPDIVHNIGIKPVLYGTWASKFIKIPIVINLLALFILYSIKFIF